MDAILHARHILTGGRPDRPTDPLRYFLGYCTLTRAENSLERPPEECSPDTAGHSIMGHHIVMSVKQRAPSHRFARVFVKRSHMLACRKNGGASPHRIGAIVDARIMTWLGRLRFSSAESTTWAHCACLPKTLHCPMSPRLNQEGDHAVSSVMTFEPMKQPTCVLQNVQGRSELLPSPSGVWL